MYCSCAAGTPACLRVNAASHRQGLRRDEGVAAQAEDALADVPVRLVCEWPCCGVTIVVHVMTFPKLSCT